MFTVDEIVKATGGCLMRGSLRSRVYGVSTDSRTARAGDLFVAIKGENFDGHRFLADVVGRGVRVVVVQDPVNVPLPGTVAVVAVKDTIKALGYVAAFHRARFDIPVVAITGSAGKTTTKEFIHAVLRTKYRVLCNKGSFNNHIGVPMTLLQLRKGHEAAVLELGTNHFGEIAWLAGLVKPTIAVFTNIGQSHLEGLGSPAGVFKEKSTLLDFLAKDGTVIWNEDDPLLKRLGRKASSRRVVRYAVEKDKADIRALRVRAERGGLAFKLSRKGEIFLRTPVWGNLYNALAALACAQVLRVPFPEAARALRRVKPAKGRQCFFRAGGVTVIDDTYNSNPVSLRNALLSLPLMKRTGRAFVVVGDMLELGKEAASIHASMGKTVVASGAEKIWTFGRWSGHMGKEAKRLCSSLDIEHFKDQGKLLDALKRDVKAGDVVLVKASRGMRMENIVNGLMADLKEKD